MQSDALVDNCNKIDRKENDSDNGENDDNHKIMPSFFYKSRNSLTKVRDLSRKCGIWPAPLS